MRGELSVIRGMLEGFRLERDRALADLEAAQMAEADVAELRQQIEAGKASGRWARFRAAWRGDLGDKKPGRVPNELPGKLYS